MRQRVEDLGRLLVMIEHLLEDELFRDPNLKPDRPKDAEEWIEDKATTEVGEIVRGWAYGIDRIEASLYAMRDIAQGADMLNVDEEL